MKAVILAAGVGSRLRPLTNTKPKCLVKVAGKPILQYQLDSYVAAGVEDICIVTGYEGEKIKEYCKHYKAANISIINNEDYENTNNMYSLYLAKEFVGDDGFILNNADLAISSRIVPMMVYSEHDDLVAVDVSMYNDESMKVTVNDKGSVVDISKKIEKEAAYGCSIDFYKFSGKSSSKLFDYIDTVIRDGNVKDWSEVAMQKLFSEGEIKPKVKSIGSEAWVEIDNYNDLALAERVFSGFDFELTDIDAFFVDLDGTVYLDGIELEGSIRTIKELRSMDKKIFFLSNNSSKSKSDYVSLLENLDLEVNVDQIILSTDGTIAFLKKNQVESVFVVGTKSLKDEVEKHGIQTDANDPEYVLLGYDTELTYAKLKKACELINSGVDYIATHIDDYCPTPMGPVPDIGAFTKLIELTTGKSPKKIFGKPNVEMVQHIFLEKNISVEKSLIVGDRLHTDIKIAKSLGMRSLLVMSGETTREAYENYDDTVDLCLNKLGDFFKK